MKKVDTYIYNDLNLNVEADVNNDFSILYDLDAIRQSIRNCIMTRQGFRTRFQSPQFGSNIYDFLFRKMTQLTKNQLSDAIEESIINWEPRVRIIEIKIETNKTFHAIHANIMYEIVNLNINDSVNVSLDVIK